MCLCQSDMGNKQRRIRCARSPGGNQVIALHLNLSADESSLEGKKNIFAHERFIGNLTNHVFQVFFQVVFLQQSEQS